MCAPTRSVGGVGPSWLIGPAVCTRNAGYTPPLSHIGPEDLRIAELIERVKTEQPREVILALAADVEGEATSLYIADQLKNLPVNITRIARVVATTFSRQYWSNCIIAARTPGRPAR